MKILVTGANGQLGRCIRLLAPDSGHSFVFTDVVEAEGLQTQMLDITDPEAVRAMVEEVLQAGEDAKDSAEAAQASEAAALLASDTAVERAGAATDAADAAEASKDAAEAAQAAAESAAELARQRAYGLTEDTDGLVFAQPDEA